MKYTINIEKAWCYDNCGYDKSGKEVERITSVVPSERQLDFMNMEYYNFIHFGINTINNAEWGTGKEDISVFNPKKLDTDQWCRVLKNTGSKGIIITAKHHDGFCLWNTKQTNHSVMHTPYGKDIVKQLSESCKKYSLKMGIYLSPWDRHEEKYGTDEYNDYFVSQLTELATNYGEIFTFWFDGACGEGKNGKKQTYDWQRYYSVIRKLQPNAVISICGPDVRWIGNEGGHVRKSEWSVVPALSANNEKIMKESQQGADEGKKMAAVIDTDEDLGSRELLSKHESLVFKPAEADVSINYGWFHNSKVFSHARRQRSAKKLAKIYFNTVGANASMLLNVPPDRDGLINKREIKKLEAFTKMKDSVFENPIKKYQIYSVSKTFERKHENKDESIKLLNDEYGIKIKFEKAQTVSTVVLSEDLRFSQRTESFELYVKTKNGYALTEKNTVIGTKRIIRLKKKVSTDELLVVVTQSRGNPVFKKILAYS